MWLKNLWLINETGKYKNNETLCRRGSDSVKLKLKTVFHCAYSITYTVTQPHRILCEAPESSYRTATVVKHFTPTECTKFLRVYKKIINSALSPNTHQRITYDFSAQYKTIHFFCLIKYTVLLLYKYGSKSVHAEICSIDYLAIALPTH